MLVLAGVQPLLLFWMAHSPPEGTVPTGLHIGDSALFLYCMRMFETGFESLYATCQSPHGTHGIVFYPVPQLWPYGVLGLVARALGIDDLTFYGIANGLGALFYLAIVYWLLREAVPGQANLAFLLFALSGGLGGILYVAAWALGLHSAPAFDEFFWRYAAYELFEGPHLLPVLHFPRFYYSLSLGLCLGGFAAFMKGYRGGGRRYLALSGALMFLGVFINMRFGSFVMVIAVLFLASQTNRPWSRRVRLSAAILLPGLLGGAASALLLYTNQAVVDNHIKVGGVAMWLSLFVSVALFHLVILPREVQLRVRGLTTPQRVCALAAIGYLGVFAALYCAYQLYYGNILIARDAAVALAISDWSLLGALAGVLYAVAIRKRTHETGTHDWVLLWLLVFLAVSISAFYRGWFLRFGPQRLEILLWLPICMLSAAGLQRMRHTWPRTARALTVCLFGCGLCSVTVSLLCFQAPLGYKPRVSPYASFHTEVMTLADAGTMEHIGPGTVLAAIPASDIIVLQRNNPTVLGMASFNLTDQPFPPLRDNVGKFFSPAASDEFRRDFVKDWCVDYVYCPDTWPIDPETVVQLRDAPWLVEVAGEGQAVLFQVVEV